MTDKQTKTFLFAIQGIGAVFVAIFLTTYFGGLPTTETLNSEPAFIFSQAVLGVLLIVFVLISIVIAVLVKLKE